VNTVMSGEHSDVRWDVRHGAMEIVRNVVRITTKKQHKHTSL